MGRPPCCDKAGVKKGPWTPEEDLVLGSYIQQHGPSNWKAVPTKTGLMRCSKSCRLRWTNYLRPGIKRGNFTEQEEGLIVHLQALFGNRWATIASYLPERTDNDVKNYWNTHLKKKLKKIQTPNQEGAGAVITAAAAASSSLAPQLPPLSKGRWETRVRSDIHMAKRALDDALALLQGKPMGSASASPAATTTTTTTTYASSAENISRLLRLQGWMENNKTRSNYSTSCSTGASSSATGKINLPSPRDDSSLLDLDSQKLDSSHGDIKIPNLTSLVESWLFEEEESVEEVEFLAYV